jgi:hypothetical protein
MTFPQLLSHSFPYPAIEVTDDFVWIREIGIASYGLLNVMLSKRHRPKANSNASSSTQLCKGRLNLKQKGRGFILVLDKNKVGK